MDAREILIDAMKARGLPSPEWEADAIINRLSLAGFQLIHDSDVKNVGKALAKAEDNAGTVPAKDSVKLRPSDWHALARAIRAMGEKK